MAKKKSWFTLLKKFFISEAHSKSEKKEKRRRWVFGRFKRNRLASIAAPSSPLPRERKLCEAEEEQQSKNDSTVAINTAIESTHQCDKVTQQLLVSDTQISDSQSTDQCEKDNQDLAATKIQTAFRGYLARKALRALKGLVRLQAIIRGRAVRRQAITTLKRLQSIVNIQSEVCAKRCQLVEGTLHCDGNEEFQDSRDKDIKIDSNSQRRWDTSVLSKEEENAMFFSKREALVKRERIKEYLLTNRRSTESEESKVNGRLRHWLEQWVDTQLAKREDFKNPNIVFPSNARIREEFKGRQLKMRNSQKQTYPEGLDSPASAPRRSFHHKKQRSIGEDSAFSASPLVPTYMAATESAKAKARSLSSPRLRPINIDAYSECNSPYKHKLSPISSINSDATSTSRIGAFQQKSPCLKGLQGPVRSNRTFKDLSFDSECSLPNWDRHSTLR